MLRALFLVVMSVLAASCDGGAYEIAYECRGSGSPTIVTESGYRSAETSVSFDLRDPLADISRVCAYDRAGTGTSDPRPDAEGLTVMDQAAELHALLEGAGIEPPYVLAGHSFGGFVSRLFASAYPQETAGLLLIESSHEDEIEPYRRFYGEGSRDADWIDGGDLLDFDATAEVLRSRRSRPNRSTRWLSDPATTCSTRTGPRCSRLSRGS